MFCWLVCVVFLRCPWFTVLMVNTQRGREKHINTAKETVFSRLQIEDVGAGYCHFPIHYDEEYFKMLTAEHCVTRFHKGVARREWVLKKGQRRNEALDIFVYNFVALKILNPNFEVLEKNMAGIEAKPLKKVNKPYKIRREGSFVSGFK